MKDIVRLEAASASSNASAWVYAPLMVPNGNGAVGVRPEGGQDRVSVSSTAQKLSERAVAAREGASVQRLASLQQQVVADTLEIDLDGIAGNLIDDMSHE